MRVAFLALVAGLGASAAGYAAGMVLATLLSRARSSVRSGPLFALRVLPAAGALVAALGLVVPGFLIHEPARAQEQAGWAALLSAAAGLLLAGSMARRAWRAWRATRGVLAQWGRSAQPIAMANAPAPAFRIAHPFPVVAVVGVIHPRLFVAGSVLQALTPGELSAVLEHETAHVRARDNVKRWLMACAPNAGWRETALQLERAWEQAAEQEADRGAGAALDLASALVKTARMAPAGTGLRVPAAAFHGGGEVARRIRELVDAPAPVRPAPIAWRRAWVFAALAVAVALPAAWRYAYQWAEALIRLP